MKGAYMIILRGSLKFIKLIISLYSIGYYYNAKKYT
mgnify:CR=1 FL=1